MKNKVYRLSDVEKKVYRVLFSNPILGTNPYLVELAEQRRIEETKDATKKLKKIFNG